MANDAAWSEGWAQGREASQHRRDRKEMLTHEQHAIKRDEYLQNTDSLKKQLNSFVDEKGNVKPEYKDQYDKAMASLSQNQYDLHQLYDPIKAPGKLQQDWNYLRERIHGIKQPQTPAAVTSQTPAATLNSPAAPISSPELPAYDQTTPRLPSQGGSVTTQEPGLAAMTSPGMQSTISLPAGPSVTVTKAPLAWKDRGSYQSPGELKKIAAARQKAQQEAELLAAGAGLSPEQEAVIKARAAAAQQEEGINATLSIANKLGIEITPEEIKEKMGFKNTIPKPLTGKAGDPIEYPPGSGLYAKAVSNPDGTTAMLPMPKGWKPTLKPMKAINAPGGPPYAVIDPNTGTIYSDPKAMPPEVKSVFDAATASYTAPTSNRTVSTDALGAVTTHGMTRTRTGLEGSPTNKNEKSIGDEKQPKMTDIHASNPSSVSGVGSSPLIGRNKVIDEVARQLINGDTDPSQIQLRGVDRMFVLARAGELDPNFQAAKAQKDYKYASEKGTTDLINYLNSLTGSDGQSGNLGELVEESNKIDRTEFPPLNDKLAWAKINTGNRAMAEYYTTITEVADQVAKILQGGGSGAGTSDAKLKQASELFDKGFTKGQIIGVADSLKKLLANRKKSIIENNYYLNKWYGEKNKAKSSEWKLPPFAPPAPKTDNKLLKDSDGNIVARSKGGNWVAP